VSGWLGSNSAVSAKEAEGKKEMGERTSNPSDVRFRFPWASGSKARKAVKTWHNFLSLSLSLSLSRASSLPLSSRLLVESPTLASQWRAAKSRTATFPRGLRAQKVSRETESRGAEDNPTRHGRRPRLQKSSRSRG
jgi:hypothetical protein